MTETLTDAELTQLGALLTKARRAGSGPAARTLQAARYHADARTHLQPLIYVDLDNTLCEFNWPGIEHYDPLDIGPPLPHAKELLEQLCELGTVRIHTARMNFKSVMPTLSPYIRMKEALAAWLEKHDMPQVELEEFPHPFAIVYVGDDAVSVLPQYDAADVARIVAITKHKCSRYREEAGKEKPFANAHTES